MKRTVELLHSGGPHLFHLLGGQAPYCRQQDFAGLGMDHILGEDTGRPGPPCQDQMS